MKKLFTLGLLISTMSVAMSREIVFSKSIPLDQRKKLQNDLNAVKNMTFSEKTPARTLKVLGIRELDNHSAYKWITNRIGHIIEDQNVTRIKDLVTNKVVNIEEVNFSYDTSLDLPLAQNEPALIVMSNLGTAIYKWGKRTNTLLSFNVDAKIHNRNKNIIIRSPRIGIVQIGAGLFSKNLSANSKNPAAISNSIVRLGTIFHEARHSDGNGEKLGFYHSVCPINHDLAGLPACDENLNGAYTVGAMMLKEMSKACGDQCSAKEKEILRILVLDSYNRVQKTTSSGTPSKDLDARPESI